MRIQDSRPIFFSLARTDDWSLRCDRPRSYHGQAEPGNPRAPTSAASQLEPLPVETGLERGKSDLTGPWIELEGARAPSVQVSRELIEDQYQCEHRAGFSTPSVELTAKRPLRK
jgi:hypothetical protein